MTKRQLEDDLAQLERLESISHNRSALADNNDYEASNSDGAPSNSSIEAEVAESTGADVSNITKERGPLKLVKRTTKEDIYEIKTSIAVDSKRFKEGRPKSRLGDVKFKCAESILDRYANWQNNDFIGFYVLFWLSIAVVTTNSIVNYLQERGLKSEIIEYLVTDIVQIGLTDLWMYLATYFIFGLHYMIKLGFIDWGRTGWIISSLYEVGYVLFFTKYAEHKNYPWIGKIFLFLHSLVLLMKMHSFSFYNGYLWNIKKELAFSKKFLKKDLNLKEDGYENYESLINDSIEFCKFELNSQSEEIKFPANVNLNNFFWYSMFPTVVYQIEYPRTRRIRKFYVMEKLAAIFGVIILMIAFAQNHMYPVAMDAIAMRELPLSERIKLYPQLLLRISPSFIVIYLLVFYLIWDAILNCIAELTRFGDRDFYGYWWNCISWDQFAREWNIPVHKFLLRHVYHSSISAFHLSKGSATMFTFLLSSLVHEGAMFVLFHKLRGYLFFLQMCQLPLVAISKTKYLREQKTLGNVIFWFGIASGPSLMCTLYLTF